MAIFHADVRMFSRAKGQSAVAAAAYRIGGALRDDRTGQWHNYARKPGVLGVHMHAPACAPGWATLAQELWSKVELRETRMNAAVARELVVALPAELPEEQRAIVACSMAEWLVQRYGIAVMTALHAPDGKGDRRNFHAHLLMTTRRVDAGGFVGKVRVLDDRATGKVEVRAIRAMVAELTNKALWKNGLSARIDHRTLRAQSLEAEARGDFVAAARLSREATRKEGRLVTAEARRGRLLEPAQRNRHVRADNRQRQNGLLQKLTPLLGIATGRRVHSGRQVVRSGRISASRADGHDAALLNAQARDLEQSLRADADDAKAFQQMLAQGDLHVTDGAMLRSFQDLAPRGRGESAAEKVSGAVHRGRAAGARSHARLTATTGSKVASKTPRTRREWADLRRKQRQSSGRTTRMPGASSPSVNPAAGARRRRTP